MNPYSSNQKCSYIFKCKYGSMKYRFNKFQIENDAECSFDKIILTDSNSTTSLCGNNFMKLGYVILLCVISFP